MSASQNQRTPDAIGPRASGASSKARGGLEVGFAYVVSVAALMAVLLHWSEVPNAPRLEWRIFAAHIAAMAAIFVFSRARNNSSFFDAYWSVIPVPTVAWLAWLGFSSTPPVSTPRAALLLTLVSAWAIRLTYNWWRGWEGLSHEDWRYVDLRRSMGRAYWLISFLGLHLFPAVLVWAGCCSLVPALIPEAVDTPRAFGALDVVAAVVTGGAIWIEAAADRQLWDFRQSKPDRSAYIQSGLWRWSRHPNYFGECSFWWGLWLFAMAADPGAWVYVTGPVLMTVLFVFISIPMMEKRTLAKRPHYREHIERTSMFVPLPPRG